MASPRGAVVHDPGRIAVACSRHRPVVDDSRQEGRHVRRRRASPGFGGARTPPCPCSVAPPRTVEHQESVPEGLDSAGHMTQPGRRDEGGASARARPRRRRSPTARRADRGDRRGDQPGERPERVPEVRPHHHGRRQREHRHAHDEHDRPRRPARCPGAPGIAAPLPVRNRRTTSTASVLTNAPTGSATSAGRHDRQDQTGPGQRRVDPGQPFSGDAIDLSGLSSSGHRSARGRLGATNVGSVSLSADGSFGAMTVTSMSVSPDAPGT